MNIQRYLLFSISGLFAVGLSALQADTDVSRGEYLVNEVAKCGDCHGPKPKVAPALTSQLLKRWKAADLRKFLETGLTPGGEAARHPMPAYKLRPDDADAMAQYLKSLE